MNAKEARELADSSVPQRVVQSVLESALERVKRFALAGYTETEPFGDYVSKGRQVPDTVQRLVLDKLRDLGYGYRVGGKIYW